MRFLPWITFFIITFLAIFIPNWRAIGAVFARIVARPIVANGIIFTIAIVLSALPLLFNRAPVPSVHDEFANLLAADTFLHGRLTNPTPQFWRHFETVHELMQPTYASKFPPGEGLALAIGRLFGSYCIGAFGSIALACAAVIIALRNWMPRRWAMLGGLLAATHPLIFSWGQSYWGGGVAMLGGAMLFAGAGRSLRRATLSSGIFIGVGLAILAISRPFEGSIVAIILAGIVVARRTVSARMIAGVLLILIPAMMWIGYYNHRVTGHWSCLPWVEYARQAMSTPIFLGQSSPPPIDYRHDKLRQFHGDFEKQEYDRQIEAGYFGRLGAALREIFDNWIDSTVLVLLIPGALLAIWRRRAARIAAILFFGLLVIHPALTPWMRPQYLAPAGAAFFAMLCFSLREISKIRRIGNAIVIGIVAAQLTAASAIVVAIIRNDHPPGIARANLIAKLEREPGKQLVLVRYTKSPQLIFEWVYNDADIEGSTIIFARSIDEASDRALLNHFKDRQFWLLNVDGNRIQFDRLREP